MTSVRDQIVESLADKEFRDLFVSERVGQRVAFQIRAMRKQRGWTQKELAQRIGTVQEVISKLEDPDYGKFTITTLLRLQSAFDVGLAVEYFPLSTIVDWSVNGAYSDLAVPAYTDDQRLWRSAATPLLQAISDLPMSATSTGSGFQAAVKTNTASNVVLVGTGRMGALVAGVKSSA